MTELPKIFNESGEFVEPDAATLAALPPEAIKRLDAIRVAYKATQDAEQNVENAQTAITEALQQVARAEELVKPFGEYGFMRLWEQSVKSR